MELGARSPAGGRIPVVAVFNSSDDIIEMFRILFEQAGFVVVSGHIAAIKRGTVDLRAFVKQHDPRVIVYDLMPPYDRNWAFLNHIRNDEAFASRQFVLTSSNAKEAAAVAGSDDRVYEIVGKPFDLDRLVQAVREAAKARPTR